MSAKFVNQGNQWDWQKIGYHARSVFAVLLSLSVLIGGSLFVYDKASDLWTSVRTVNDYEGEGKLQVEVIIPRGASANQIGGILAEAGVIKSVRVFRDEARRDPRFADIKAGRYRLKTELPAKKAIAMLLDPANRIIRKITLAEGLTVNQEFQAIAKKFEVKPEDLKAELAAAKLPVPEWAGDVREGLLFPETYAVLEPLDAKDLFVRQVNQFNKVAKKIDLVGKAKALDMDPLEVLVVASIVEREAVRAEDRPMVAAVIYNRLEAGMKLEMDSTVHYAIGKFDKITTTEEQRKTESVYNTYRIEGLPPAPICNPGQAALEAALNPSDTKAKFFVTVNPDTGETRFAEKLKEHEENVKLFQQWCSANEGRCS